MSTQQQHLSDIAAAIREKEDSVAPIQALTYADRIRALELVDKPHEVMYIDTDGTVIASARYNDGEAAAYPEPPQRDGLEFMGWTHSPEYLSNITRHEYVGAVWRAERTQMWFEPTPGADKYNELMLYFHRPESSSVPININWGDGTPDERYVLAGTSVTRSHIYPLVEGKYQVEIWTDGDVPYGLGNGTSSAQIALTGRGYITKMYLAENAVLKNYSCQSFSNLREIVFPRPGINTILPEFCFNNCYQLRTIIIPFGYSRSIPRDWASYNYELMYAVMPPDTIGLGAYSWQYCIRVSRWVLPKGITSIPKYAFQSGGYAEIISDVIGRVDDYGLSNFYGLTGIDLADTVVVGNGALSNLFCLHRDKDITLRYSTTMTASELCSWWHLNRGQITVLGDDGLTLPSITNLHGCHRLTIGGNFSTIKGSIATQSIMEYVVLADTPPVVTINVLAGINIRATVYVPDASLDAYKTAQYWSANAGYYRPLSALPE